MKTYKKDEWKHVKRNTGKEIYFRQKHVKRKEKILSENM